MPVTDFEALNAACDAISVQVVSPSHWFVNVTVAFQSDWSGLTHSILTWPEFSVASAMPWATAP